MASELLVITGGTLVPMRETGEAFDGELIVADGRIVEVRAAGTPSALPAPCLATAERIDASGCLVTPGFVQGHVHTVQTLLRHQADDLELLDWLKLRTWPYEASLTASEVGAAARLGIAELIAGGTTTILDFGTTHDHDQVFAAVEEMGIRAFSGKTHMDEGNDVPTGLFEETEESLAEAAALAERWHGAANNRIRYAICPRFALSCTRRLFEESAQMARQGGWLLHTHASENRGEVEAVRELTGLENIDYLESVGWLGEDVVLAHGVHLSDHEVERLAATGTSVCHCPGANLKLASGIADVPRLRNSGVEVALGADGPPCNNRLSIFSEMSLAATLHKVQHGPRAMDAWTVLEMATIGGARALGLEAEIGTLEVGKKADVCIVGTSSWAMQPAGDPAARLVYGATAAEVRDVVVDGRILYRDGRLLSASPETVLDEAQRSWSAVSARMRELT